MTDLTKEEREDIVYVLEMLTEECHQNSARKGFWTDDYTILKHLEESDDAAPLKKHRVNVMATRLMLIVSELAEGLEAIRHGNPSSEHIPDFDGLSEELADVIIRVCDLAGYLGLNIGNAVVAKMDYNAGREHMHGKQC